MNKRSLTILLGVIWIILLTVVVGFWYGWSNDDNGNVKMNNENKIIQYKMIHQHIKSDKKIDAQIDTSDWEIYQDDKNGITIRYPKTLKLTQNSSGIKMEDAKSGEWAGTLKISKGKSDILKVNRLTPDKSLQSIIEWEKEGYILTGDRFVVLTRGVFKDAKTEGDKKSDLLGLGYFFSEAEPIAHIILDASYKIKDNIWHGIVKSIKVI